MIMKSLAIFCGVLMTTLATSPAAARAQLANLKVVPFTDVRVEPDSFWGRYITLARDHVAPANLSQCELSGRVRNFAIAAGQRTGGFQGRWFFNDSDVYKTLEGVAYCLSQQRDPRLEAEADYLI